MASSFLTPLVSALVLHWGVVPASGAEGKVRNLRPALSPEEALAAFQLEPGLRIEVVAAEPLVIDPVAFAFDEDGRLFVVEGRGYPDPIDGKGAVPVGRIVRLDDTDGDGRCDRRVEFATGLGYANGITPWRGGFFVTAAPEVLYLKDHDGDGVADERRVVLTGFDASKTAQLRASHPTLGADGKIYLTSGLSPGKITSPAHPERAAVVFSPRDGRFDPDTFIFESTGGRGQYGLAFDAFGRRFISSNRHPILQVMLEPWHLRRNPHFAFGETTQEVSKVEAEAKVRPISRASVSADFIPALMAKPHSGTFTSACAVLIFGGTALRPEHVGNAFVCEPAQNLVQRQILRGEGSSFRAEVADAAREFLASTDVWFRPVFLGHGPDGALYLADMYRREIDHPVYVPEESRAALDFESGKDRGRIYRIVRDDGRARERPAPQSASRTAQTTLVEGLTSANAWTRERAARLLIEQGAKNDAPTLTAIEQLARAGEMARVESRVAAARVLQTLGGMTPALARALLQDPDSALRETAASLAGESLPRAPELMEPLLAAARDPDSRVRFAATLALGDVSTKAATQALAEAAAGGDRWLRAAALSGIGGRMQDFIAALRAVKAADQDDVAALLEQVARMVGASGDAAACRELLAQAVAAESADARGFGALLGLADGLKSKAGTQGLFAELFDRGASARLARTFTAARELAANRGAASRERRVAVALLGFTDYVFAEAALASVLDAREPIDLQMQAVRALERLGERRSGELLTRQELWSGFTPQLREAAIAALVSKPALAEALFAAIKERRVAATDLSSARRGQLLKHGNPAIRAAAARAFAALESGDRMAVYRRYRDALGAQSEAEAERGRGVFMRACSACHSHQGTGGKVGPDLTGIRNQPREAILLHILVPNYEVAPQYQTLALTLEDGRALTGWLMAETEAGLTLRTAAGTEETVLRTSIATLAGSASSLMPDGLEQTISTAEMTDLIQFLKANP